MSNELVKVNENEVVESFSAKDGLIDIITKTEEAVKSFEHDLSTAAGRKKTASLAAKVASFKVKLDTMGKDLTDEWAKKKKAVDINRKQVRDRLDELKVLARKPLSDWEDEQEQIKIAEKARQEAEALALKIGTDHEIAILMDREHDRQKQEAIELAEKQRLEDEQEARRLQEAYEKKIIDEARAQAQAELRESKLREEQAIKDKIRLEEDAKAAAIRAEENAIYQKKLSEEMAVKAAEDARIAEENRHKAAALAEKQRQEALEQNKRHVGNIRRQSKEDFMSLCGVDEATAKKIVMAIAGEKIRNVKLNIG